MRSKITEMGTLPRFWSRVIDRIEYAVTSVRLAILDRIWGPELATLADRQREAQKEKLKRAFPAIV